MKVLMMSKEYPPDVYGGAGVHIRYLTQELSKLLELEVRCFGEVRELDARYNVKRYQPWDFLKCEGEPRFQSAFNALSTNLAMICEWIDFDIVHTHTWYAHYAGYLSKILYKVPFVATCHSLEPLRPWKKDQLSEAFNISTMMERAGIYNADKVIAVSQLMKDDILKHFQIPEENVEIIHNGVDLDKWKYTPLNDELRNKYGINKDYILFVGRPTPQKGMEYLIEAMDKIDIQLVMGACGADTKEYEDKMTKLVEKKDNIVWIHELLKEEEYVQLYSSAKVFVCPSVYEPFGIINLEAMACETPVVASAVGGIKEVVVNDVTGILVEPAQPDQIAEAVNYILKHDNIAKKMGENSRKRVEEKFSWKFIAKQTKDLYEKLASHDKFKYSRPIFDELRKNYISKDFTLEGNVLKAEVEAPPERTYKLKEEFPAEVKERYFSLGAQAIKEGKVGYVIVNGGMATRFGGVVKGTVKVYDDKSFLQVKLEQVKKIQEKYGVEIPIYIMNSFATSDATREHFRRNENHGFKTDKIRMFTQYIFKRLNPDGSKFYNPDEPMARYYGPGHGDFLYSFKKAKYLPQFLEEGGKYLLYSNVDNLGATIDEVIIGHHIAQGKEMTVELAKKNEGDKGGAPAVVDGNLQIVEQFKFPAGFDQDTIPYFNTANYVIDAKCLEQDIKLPWYVVEKVVKGKPVIQFEILAGDLSIFLNTGFIVIDREQRFIPIKKPGDLAKQKDWLKKKFEAE